ncbi:MAG: hypothetical protein UHX00_02660 [Caryophanon sp.]|nr:hypothetical protein [Caryophanon sp.]
MDYNKFFANVLFDLGKSLYNFIRWLNSPRIKKPIDDLDILFSGYNEFFDYVEDLGDEEFYKFRKHLTTQYYKLLEKIGPDRNAIRHSIDEEDFILDIVGMDSELVCRLINESIHKITIDDGDINVTYYYEEEIENLTCRYRSYNSEEVKLVITNERKINDIVN